MRLIHRRQRETPLAEEECYDHSYGEHVSAHVDVVPLDPSQPVLDLVEEPQPEHHVTTRRLKDQFEQRLASRRRRH